MAARSGVPTVPLRGKPHTHCGSPLDVTVGPFGDLGAGTPGLNPSRDDQGTASVRRAVELLEDLMALPQPEGASVGFRVSLGVLAGLSISL